MLLCVALTACDKEEKGSYPPTYQGFRYVPSTVYAGDSVTITAVQLKKGHYLNTTKYSWSMTVQVDNNGVTESKTLTHAVQTNYGGISDADPVWGVRLPANTQPGTYACSFKAEWSNSADGIGGTFNGGTGESCTGNINSYSYTLYSQANGSFRLTVR